MIVEQERVQIVAGEILADLVAQVKDSVVQVHSGRHGSGSGVVWRADGIVMTNHHVIARSDRASVLFNDDREIRADVIARDPVLDLAALRVDGIGLSPARVGASQHVRIGELVVAIGHPWGQRGIVTAGIVSGIGAVDTPWRQRKAEYIRSDVRLAPGNSGGPLLNARGEVIGINAMIFGGDLGVAIPSHIATQFLQVAEGKRPFLGVTVQPIALPHDFRAATQREQGLLIIGVQTASAAAEAGLYIGDVLLDVDGQPVVDAHSLTYMLAQQRAGAEVPLRFVRAGNVHSTFARLDTAPFPAAA